MAYEEKKKRFLSILREDYSGVAGNISLRARLGWNENLYNNVKDALLEDALITRAPGKGGSVHLTRSLARKKPSNEPTKKNSSLKDDRHASQDAKRSQSLVKTTEPWSHFPVKSSSSALPDPETKSPDIVEGNIAAIEVLFPDAFEEGKIDFEVLKQLLGGTVDEREEKYGLNWHGKRSARQIALTPSTGTLLPCPRQSVDWEATRNILIEGDNLEVLKLLQKSYAARVKVIYIDPPYNTGKDFVYPDNFRDSIRNYLELTGQIEGNAKISSNTDASGRFHTDWLNMMLPRLKLARTLLRDDGVIFISISDVESASLRMILAEIFGEENFLANIVWQKKYAPQNDDKYFSDSHEHIIAFCRNKEHFSIGLLGRTEEANARYKNPDDDPRGPWKSSDLTRQEYRPRDDYEITSPKTGRKFSPPKGNSWGRPESVVEDLIRDNRIWFGPDGNSIPSLKRFLSEVKQGITPQTLWLRTDVGDTQEGKKIIKDLFGDVSIFETAKPVRLIRQAIITSGCSEDDIVLDFFAGSGTTGHAVMEFNSNNSTNCRYILVQLQEPTGRDDFKSITDITAERLRRAAEKIRTTNPMFSGDTGFRVYRLAPSNIRAWEPDSSDIESSLLKNAEHLVQGRTEQDVLYELLLKLGLDLCVPIQTKLVSGKSVHAIGGGTLIVCLADGVTKDLVEPLSAGILAWRKELAPAVDTRVVFKDSGFADDIAKTNMAAILNQNGIADVRSL